MAAFGLDTEEVLKASKPNAARMYIYIRAYVCRTLLYYVLHIHVKYLSITCTRKCARYSRTTRIFYEF